MKNKGFAGNLLKFAAAASLALALTGCGSKTVNISDYVTVEYEGYDTVGKAVYTVDFDTMIEENLKAFDLDEDSSKKAVEKVKSRLAEDIKGELDKTSNLSNGDEITFEWDDIDVEDIEEDFSVKITFEDKVFVVENLEEPEKFDPFEYITVTYSGIAPNGEVKISSNSLPVSEIYFEADKTSGLKNGDVVKVTVKSYYDDMNQLGIAYGMIPSVTEKEYTVEGLSSYALSFSEIPEDMQAKMKQQAEDTFRAGAAGWAEGSTLKGMECIGAYFLSVKDGFSARPTNEVYLVYKMTASITGVLKEDENKTEATADEVYYTFYKFSNVMILSDGVCSVDLSAGEQASNRIESTRGYYSWGFNTYRFNGYHDLDTMFNDCVTKNIEKYNYESTVEAK